MKKQLVLFLTLCLLAEVVSILLHKTIASSVIALFLLLFFLFTKLIKVHDIKEVGELLLNNMTLLFIPSAVGIMEHLDLVGPVLLPILLIVIVSTVLTLVVAGGSAQLVLRAQERKKKHVS